LAFSPAGVLHVTEETAGRISQIGPAGSVTPVITGLTSPEGIAFDDTGNLYVVEDIQAGRLVERSSHGVTTTLATDLDAPEGAVWASDDLLYVTESNMQFVTDPTDLRTRIAVVSSSGVVTRVITNTPTISGTDVTFWSYAGLAIGPDGSLYVTNEISGQEITQTVVVIPGVLTTTFTLSTTDSIFTVDPATGDRALFASGLVAPEGLRFSANGEFPLYVAEEDVGGGAGRLSRIEPDGSHTPLCTGFFNIEDVAVDQRGWLYVSEDSNGLVILIKPNQFLDLPFDYPGRDTGSATAFNSAFLGRTKSLFDHDLPDDDTNQRMLPYLGYGAISYPAQRFPCGPPNCECHDGHDGYDFAQWFAGEPVLAAASGTIDDTNTGWGCLGWHVTIDHGNGYQTVYGHLREQPTVTGHANAGDPIGIIGNTFEPPCVSRDPHLHFELQFTGIPVDPSGWLDASNPDPWVSHPNGSTSHHLWRHLVPTRERRSIDGQTGGSFTSASGSTTVHIPTGAFSGSWDLALTEVPVAEPSAQLKPTGHSFTLEASEAQQSGVSHFAAPFAGLGLPTVRTATAFTKPLTLTVQYTDTDIGDLAESTLSLYLWDDQASSWTPLTTTLHPVNNVATANTGVLGLFALLADDNDLQGPAIGQPVFDTAVVSSEWLTVTVAISDTLTGKHGVDFATLYYSYTAPYTQTAVIGVGPGDTGDGTWTFAIPPQDEMWAGAMLKFSIEATDGDLSPVASINDNGGSYFTVTITPPRCVYLPLILKSY